MGTNFYMLTKNKKVASKYFGEYELTEQKAPYLAYEVHIAKTSGGWKPLFQGNKVMNSVTKMKECYDTGEVEIFDEYGTEYNWEGFVDRVVNWNPGGRSHDTGMDEEGYDFLFGDFV